jgi:hypothetical protein
MTEITVKPVMLNPRSVKCPRCWQYHTVAENYDNLCDRCQNVILKHFPEHESADGIRASIAAQIEKYTVKKD